MFELLLDNNFLTSLIAFAIILIPAVIIHEFGHFIAARIVGINVLEFGIGFPPRLKRLFVWGETEFTLNWLPIGGFVRPLGEDMIGPTIQADESGDFSEEGKTKNSEYISEREELMNRGVPEHKLMSVNEAKPLGRIFFMAAGAIANVLSAMLVFIIAALIGIPSEVGARMQIIDVPDGSIFARTDIVIGDAVEKVNGEFFWTPVDFFDAIQNAAGESVTLLMRHPEDFPDGTLAGQSYEVTIPVSSNPVEPYVLISVVVEGAPGAQAGLLPGDKIVAVNGQSLDANDPAGTVTSAAEAYAGQLLALDIIRGQSRLEIAVTPRVVVPAGEGRIGLGISPQYAFGSDAIFRQTDSQVEMVPQSVGNAISYGLNRTVQIFQLIASIPGQLMSGNVSPEEARPVSIVGISQIGGQFLRQSIRDGSPIMVLEFLGLISIFLGITNLLPLPPLDGGRIVFVLIEMLRGKPVSPRIEYAVHRIGITLLLSLGVIIIIYDIFNPLA